MQDYNNPAVGGNMPLTPSNDERNIAMLVHILSIFGSFVGPLVIYLVKKEESPFIAQHAKNALNFQISMFIYCFIAWILIFVLIGIILLPILGILQLIFCIMAAIAAHDGKMYQYPLTIKFLS